MSFGRVGLVWAVAAAPLLMGSCAGRGTFHKTSEHRPVQIRRSDYPVLPGGELGAQMRAKAAADPGYAERFFWGRYGGPGNSGGPPCDAMDELFYWHDVAYLDGVRLWELRKADWRLIRELRRLEIDALPPGARKFRRRAILYFRLPISWFYGKPKDVLNCSKAGPSVIWVGEK